MIRISKQQVGREAEDGPDPLPTPILAIILMKRIT